MLLIALFIGSIATALAAEKVTFPRSTTVLPLVQAEAESYDEQQAVCQITITGGGTGAGITAAGEGRSEIAMASRTINYSERKLYSKNNFHQFFIGYDGIWFVVSNPYTMQGSSPLPRISSRISMRERSRIGRT